jgi:hypothetical protein
VLVAAARCCNKQLEAARSFGPRGVKLRSRYEIRAYSVALGSPNEMRVGGRFGHGQTVPYGVYGRPRPYGPDAISDSWRLRNRPLSERQLSTQTVGCHDRALDCRLSACAPFRHLGDADLIVEQKCWSQAVSWPSDVGPMGQSEHEHEPTHVLGPERIARSKKFRPLTSTFAENPGYRSSFAVGCRRLSVERCGANP